MFPAEQVRADSAIYCSAAAVGGLGRNLDRGVNNHLRSNLIDCGIVRCRLVDLSMECVSANRWPSLWFKVDSGELFGS